MPGREPEPFGFNVFIFVVRAMDLWFFRVPNMFPEPLAAVVFLGWLMANLMGAYAVLFRLAHGSFPPWS